MNDLGLNDFNANQFITQEVNQGPSDENFNDIPATDDTDEDLDDLPSQEETTPEEVLEGHNVHLQVNRDCEVETTSSLSTIRESSPVNSIEEWSPSPSAEENDNPSAKSSRNNQASNNHGNKQKSLPKGLVHNCLAKWKNIIKK